MGANAFYPGLPFLELGIEWLLGRKKELTHESGHINRIQGTLKLNF